MPLLKGRFMSPVKPLTDVAPGKTVYTIEHTREQFVSKNEYEKRVALYNEQVWTCQCTGAIKLSHEEACKSEAKIQLHLKENFAEVFEKPVLELVHHSTEVLDALTDKAWRLLNQTYIIGEKVTLKVKAQGRTIEGTVVKVSQAETNGIGDSSTSSSPSSNKENVENKKGAEAESPGRKQHPKLLPHRYNIKLLHEDKIINGIPAEDLLRVERPPPKELIKTFIRSSAWRGGYQTNSPWVVNEDLVAKYSLPSKFADLFVSPVKIAELGRKALEESASAKKRKTLLSRRGPTANKKLKLDIEDTHNKKQSKLTLKPGSPKKGQPSPKKTPQKGSSSSSSPRKAGTPRKRTPKKQAADSGSDSDSESSSDEDLTLADLKEKVQSPSKTAMTLADLKKKMAEKMTTNQGEKKKRGRPKKNPDAPPKVKRPRGRPKKEDSLASASNTPTKKKKMSSESPKKGGSSNKKMKQATLFDLKGRKKNATKGTPTKSPRKAHDKSPLKSPKRMPPLAVKLQKCLKSNSLYKYKRAIECAKVLSQKQIDALPQELQELIMKQKRKIEEKKKMAKMTPEEKKAYIKVKLRNAMRKRALKNKRCEDTKLELKPLPMPKLVPTPDGLANELFGDITMVTEFVNCYQGLFIPESETLVRTDLLMKALVASKGSCGYLFEVLTILLKTLLQDEIAEDYEELSVRISQLPINRYTASELVRLSLRNTDSDDDSDEEEEEFVDDTVPEELLDQLETTEMCDLQPQEKVKILVCLCHRIMNSYSVQDFMNERLAETSELWRKRLTMFKEKKEERLKNKENKKQGAPAKEKNVKEEEKEKSAESDKKNLTIESFYGAKPEEDEGADLASVVKRRRVLAAKAAEEKRKKEREERERREKEMEVYQKQKADENFEKTFFKRLMVAKLVQRQTPIGTDRNHDRYWTFHRSTPGLYIEKGWAQDEMTYCVQPKNAQEDSSSDSSSESEDEKVGLGRPKKPCPKILKGETFPHIGQNLWFVYDTVEEVDKLIESLHALGEREGTLVSELKKQHDHITKGIKAMPKPEEDVAPTGVDLLDGFRNELVDLEARLRNGGLGGVHNFEAWEKKVLAAETIPDLVPLMKESTENIFEKFRKGMLLDLIEKPKVKSKDESKEKEEADEEKGDDKSEKDEEEEEEEEEEDSASKRWEEALNTCPTLSRLHLLLGMVEACIKWEKSAENAKCKICRKKGDEDHLLLCDECNQAFHLYCLRPAMIEVPPGDWFCPACVPSHKRRESRQKNYRQLAGEYDDDESDDEDRVVHETSCAVCDGTEEKLVECTVCPSVFHMDCHEPPLRHTPRSSWRCMQCKTGVRIRRSRRSAGKQRKRYIIPDELDDEEDEEEEYEEEAAPPPTKRARTSRNSLRTAEHPETPPEPKPLPRSTRQSGGVDYSELCEPETVVRGMPRQTSKSRVNNKTKVEPTKVIEKVLYRLQKHKSAWPFREPVDPQDVPDYYSIVKNPVDLFTMREKNKAEEYNSLQEFVDDIALMFNNGYLYNKPDSTVGSCIPPVEKIFKDMFKSNFAGCNYTRDLELSQSCMMNGEIQAEGEEGEDEGSPPKTLGSDHAYSARH